MHLAHTKVIKADDICKGETNLLKLNILPL